MGRAATAWRCLAVAAAALVAAGGGALLLVASGLYNIAASEPHWAITYRLLDFAKRRSVETQSLLINAPATLDDPERVKLGAAHFLGGCAPCHGAPGQARNPVVSSMLPGPADLMRAVPTWTPPQLFWIVRNGFKYTGMPAWPDIARDDEVWSVVAFLRQLPTMSGETYLRLATGGLKPAARSARDVVEFGAEAEALSRCGRCHEPAAPAAASELVPRLAHQSRAYIELALRDYAQGRRPSGVMRPVVAELDDETIALLAAYYAGLRPAKTVAVNAAASVIRRGKEIAERGDTGAGVPPCLACHGGRSAPTFPLLDGQSARYLATQLRLWKNDLRMGSVQGRIMGVIAARLSDDDIDSVTHYFASVPATTAPTPAPRPGR